MAYSVLTAALAWAAKGIPVFPSKNNPGKDNHKAPLTPRGFYDATTDAATIRAWWEQWPNAYISMPTGPASGFDVIDIDRKNGKDGTKAILNWESLSPIKSFTTSGGIHLWFRSDRTLNCRNNLFDGVDLKADGGYVIIPPSEGYRWANGADLSVAELPCVPEDLRPKLIEREPRQRPDGETIDIARLKAALAVIDADDRDTWVRVGMALQTELGDDGEEIWIEWSQTSSKWEAKDAKQWRTFEGYSNVTAGTIFHLAKEANPSWARAYERDWLRSIDRAMQEGHLASEAELRDGESGEASSGAGEAPNEAGTDETENETQADAPWPIANGPFFTSGDFIQGYTPPDYVLDGIVQRGFLYALTGRSNSGKTAILHRLAAHAAMGTSLCGREIEKTKVLYLAGENPDDHRMRFILLCDELKVDPASLGIHWLPFCVDLSGDNFKKALEAQDTAYGPFGLIIADTSQAYFQGKDENDNPQMLDHAKMFRGLTALLASRPAIMVSCHPTKNGDKLIPRGGSSFYNEIDTNLCVNKREHTTVADLHWSEKIRGVDFAPLPFELRKGQSEKLKDAKDRKIWSVIAVPISEALATGIEETNEARAMEVLSLLAKKPDLSLPAMASELGWYYSTGEPNKSLAERLINSLASRKLIDKGPPRTLTRKGCRARAAWEENHGPDAI